jgi:hypothetical protein
VTLMASIPTLSLNLRTSINRNLYEIVELHEELLGDLHNAVPHSEYTQPISTAAEVTFPKSSNGHHRWQSLDAVPEHKRAWLQMIPGMTADPKIAAEVARVFGRKVRCQCNKNVVT